MTLCIHRGNYEIGGSCVELSTDTTRLIIDIGLPLAKKDGSELSLRLLQGYSIDRLIADGILPNVRGLYNSTESKPDALLISHAHQDHFGLMGYISPDVPVYMSPATETLISINKTFGVNSAELNNVRHFDKIRPFEIGDITITPYWTDHSAFDSYSFLIEAAGKRVFYSGDFRAHGRRRKAFEWFTHNAPKDIDYLMMEGTTISRGVARFKTEDAIEREFTELFRSHQSPMLVYTSGQNVDRLVSVYRACIKSGKLLIVDVYVAYVLHKLAAYAGIPHPSKSFPLLKVFYSRAICNKLNSINRNDIMYRFKYYKITPDELNQKLNDAVVLVRPTMQQDMERLDKLHSGVFVYSLWSGYAEKGNTKKFREFLKSRGFIEKEIHTSGHADIPTLKRMVSVVNPKTLIPIHTDSRVEYSKHFNLPVQMLEDGVPVVL